MKKRVICLLLSLFLLVSLVTSAVLPVFAVTELNASVDCVAVLKKMEGFSKYPVYDYGQYSIGYGTACPGADLQHYRVKGITEAEADKLLRSSLQSFALHVKQFAVSNNLKLNQNQFDALVLLTYNIGPEWMKVNSDLKNAVLQGATGNDLIYYMSRWCIAGERVLPSLIKRRLAEADLFLNGNYSAESPGHYSFVLFDPAGGDCTSRVQGYDASNPAAIKAVPTRDGYRFLGWYTEPEGGQWITDLDTHTAEKTLYAHWQAADGNVANGVIQGTSCTYKRKTNSASALSVYEYPNAAKPFAHLDAGILVKIVADYVDSAGAKWGKMAGGGWINLGTTHQELHPAARTVKNNVTVTVTSEYVNVRSGAGASHSIVDKVQQGDRLVISEIKLVDTVKWGRYSGGWLCLDYTDYASPSEEKTETDTTNTTATATGSSGVVVNCGNLRVRSGPGTGYVTVSQLPVGTKVEITQTQTVGAAVWGKISKGWICLSYVQLDENSSTEPEQGNDENTTDGRIGTVINCTKLNVRSGPGTSHPAVNAVYGGNRVVIYEIKTVANVPWARIDQGWVCMNYVQTEEAEEKAEVETEEEEEKVQKEGQPGLVVSGDAALNVRSGAGLNHPRVTTLANGTVINIYETTTVNGVDWGRTDQGWVCMTYIRMDGEPMHFGTVTADSLRIRSAAGTNNSVVGGYNYGTQVEILETTQVGNTTWGRTNQGWISLAYVKY